MFTVNHFIWLFICFSIIGICAYLISHDKISFDKLIKICCAVCILSECAKVFSVIKILPLTSGNGYAPYLEMNHLPIHLCSIQIIFIFILRFINKESKLFHRLIAFMYPACVIGAFIALFIPTIFTTTISVDQAFSHEMSYQFFLYHTMLVVLGIGIYHFFKDDLDLNDYFKTMVLALILFFVSIYLNSIFSIPHYDNGELVSIDKSVNFFFSFNPPINIPINNINEWILYLVVLMLIGSILVFLVYLPIIIRKKNSLKHLS